MTEEWTKVQPAMNPTWEFEKQTEIVGIYKELKEDVGENHSNLYTLQTSKGPVSVWGSKVLDDRFNIIPKGSEVKIVYLGKVKTAKGGREYNNFEVYSRPQGFKEVKPDPDKEINVGEIPM